MLGKSEVGLLHGWSVVFVFPMFWGFQVKMESC
jgi:hypothetical protein